MHLRFEPFFATLAPTRTFSVPGFFFFGFAHALAKEKKKPGAEKVLVGTRLIDDPGLVVRISLTELTMVSN